MRECTLLEHKINYRITEFLDPVYMIGKCVSAALAGCPVISTDGCPSTRDASSSFLIRVLCKFFYFPTHLRSSWCSLKGWCTCWRQLLEGILEGDVYATQREMVQLRVLVADFGKTPPLCHHKSHSEAQGPERNSCSLLLLETPGK